MARTSKYAKLLIHQKMSDEDIKEFVKQDVLKKYPDAVYAENAYEESRRFGFDTPYVVFQVNGVERKKENAKVSATFYIQDQQPDGFGPNKQKLHLEMHHYTLNDFDCQISRDGNRKTIHKPWTKLMYEKSGKDPKYLENLKKYEEQVLNAPLFPGRVTQEEKE